MDMILSDTQRNLIESLDGQPCLYSCVSTHRPAPPAFESKKFRSSMILSYSCDVEILERETQIIIGACDDELDATIETYIFTK